jgi:hypothetical protein
VFCTGSGGDGGTGGDRQAEGGTDSGEALPKLEYWTKLKLLSYETSIHFGPQVLVQPGWGDDAAADKYNGGWTFSIG